MTPLHRTLWGTSTLVLALVVAGCGGSALDPRTAVSANAAVHGVGRDAGATSPSSVVLAPQAPASRSHGVPNGLVPVAQHDGSDAPASLGPDASGKPGAAPCTRLHHATGITD